MKNIIILSVAMLGVLGGFFFNYRSQVLDLIFEYKKASLPEAMPYTTTQRSLPAGRQGEQVYKMPDEEILPDSVNLAVPFTPQAPHANWDLPYKETCEEASLLMVARYKKGEEITSPEDADQEIRKLIDFQNEFFGDYKDTTAEQTAEIARKYYDFENTEVIYDFTIDDIKKALSDGNPVMVPAAGRELGNPYFRRPGPLYHMLVIRGYTEDKFITNDPGTKRGEEFVYDYDVLVHAVHDWNGGEVESGRKAMIVIK